MAIVKMNKVSLVVLDKERKESLEKLRKVGLVHLEAIEGEGAKLTAFKETFTEVEKAISVLSEIKLPKKSEPKQVSLSYEECAAKAKEILQATDKKKSLLDSINQDTQELKRFELWGMVDLDDLSYLAEKGLYTYMYEIPSESYANIGEDVKTILVNTANKVTRFLLVSETEVVDRPDSLPSEAYSVPLPRASIKDIQNDIENAKKEIAELEKFVSSNKQYLNTLKDYKKALSKDIEFENVYSGMEHEEECETPLAWISGYVPVDSMEAFKTACKENEWAYTYAEPEEEDTAVPTKLKNNKFVSLIYPLTDFLGTVPGYREFDISAWFLFFFTIFFGMIFGDGGYGLLITAAILFMMIKNKANKKPFAPALGLGLLVGLATVVWGLVTCTWFGIPCDLLPEWLTKASIPWISSAYEDSLWVPFWISEPGVGLSKDQNLQIFCFSLALLQLSVAHIKAMGRSFEKKNPVKALGDLGSLLQLIGMFWIVLSMVVDSRIFPMLGSIGSVPVGKIEVSLIGVGFVLSFVFSNYEGSIGKSILASLKNIISVLLGVVNVFSDIVSYIRLWAVGLAGGAISSTVNTMAGPILGHAIFFILAVALLVFGHGLNMILNVLSVIVHGVRLNTLEFSTHMGVSWSGIKYEPFSEKK